MSEVRKEEIEDPLNSCVCVCVCVCVYVCVWLCLTVVHQAPLSVELSKQEYWSGPFPSPGDLPDLWIEPRSLELQADSLSSETLNSCATL